MNEKKIIVALDNDNILKTLELVEEIKNEVNSFKIGYEFFFNFGIEGYNQIKKISSNIFLDLKLHDIPNTVEKGIKAISKLKPKFTTIHISGGDEMMKASLLNKKETKILGVSVLTSLNDNETNKYYNEKSVESLVKKFVLEAKKFNLDGIVCSPKEVSYIRKLCGKNFIIVTPGIRLNNVKLKDDQKRTLSPREAIKLGSDYLVIGRPITKAKNPLKTIKEINSYLK